MFVSDIIVSAMRYLGMDKEADAVDDGSYSEDENLKREVGALVHCYNAVEDELARAYFPLEYEEELPVSVGTVYYSVFAHSPIKILSVTSEGKALKYTLKPRYMEVDAKTITVKYTYLPLKKQLNHTSDYTGYPVSERLMAYGVAAEYSLICGDIEASECWESRYTQELARLRPITKGGQIPVRGWV